MQASQNIAGSACITGAHQGHFRDCRYFGGIVGSSRELQGLQASQGIAGMSGIAGIAGKLQGLQGNHRDCSGIAGIGGMSGKLQGCQGVKSIMN